MYGLGYPKLYEIVIYIWILALQAKKVIIYKTSLCCMKTNCSRLMRLTQIPYQTENLHTLQIPCHRQVSKPESLILNDKHAHHYINMTIMYSTMLHYLYIYVYIQCNIWSCMYVCMCCYGKLCLVSTRSWYHRLQQQRWKADSVKACDQT